MLGVGSCPSADPVLSYLCLRGLSSSRAERPCPFGRGAATSPHPWQGGVQQLENALSCLSFVLEGSLQYFPSSVPMEPLQGAAKSCARAGLGSACGMCQWTSNSWEHPQDWPWLLSAPSLFPLLLSWLLAEN